MSSKSTTGRGWQLDIKYRSLRDSIIEAYVIKTKITGLLAHTQFILAFLLYFLGMASMFASDLMISRMAEYSEVATWATLKSSLFIGAALCLLGLDHALVRSPKAVGRIAKILIPQLLIGAIFIIFILNILGLIQNLFWSYTALLGVIAASLFFAIFRSRNDLLPAQIALNFWKIILFVTVATLFYFDIARNYEFIVTISIIFSAIVVVFVWWFFSDHKPVLPEDKEKSIADFYQIGLRFCVSVLLLNLSIYLEQILLNIDKQTTASALYFSHMAIFIPLIIFVNGYFGFILGPYIKRNQNKFHTLAKKYFGLFLFIGFILSLASLTIGIFVFSILYAGRYELDMFLALLITLIAFLRFIYIVPSAYLGVAASKIILDRFLWINILGIVSFIAVYYVVSRLTENFVYAVAVGSVVNWLMRVGVGFYLSFKILRNHTLEKGNL